MPNKPVTRIRGMRSPVAAGVIVGNATTKPNKPQATKVGSKLSLSASGGLAAGATDFSVLTHDVSSTAAGSVSTVGASGTFKSGDVVQKTVTVTRGRITSIV